MAGEVFVAFRGGQGLDQTEKVVTPADPLPVTVISGGGGAVTIADGADVAQGAVGDSAVAAGAAGTLSAKLRRLTTDIGSLVTGLVALGQAAMAASVPVVVASDQSTLPVEDARSSTATLTALASAATSAQLLASTAGRKGLILTNTDANSVYVKYGTTASATSFTVLIPANGYWEMPKPMYTGRIDAIWAADGSGSLYATELT